jgi:DHA2 family multidrug resistance protein-like MFS transporter
MASSAGGTGSLKAGRREWLGLAALALPTLLTSIDLFVLLLALPSLSAALKATSIEQLWITDIYGFLLSGFMITMGTLGDRVGLRKVLMTGAAGFGAASLLAAFSSSAGMLIAARALLGIAGAALAPSTLALIRQMFRDERERASAIGVWLTCLIGGAVVGPLVGGVMLQHFWWGSVFLIGVPAMVLLLLVGRALLPEYRSPEAGTPHVWSALLFLASVLTIMYGIKEGARNGWLAIPTASVVAGAALGVVFVRLQAASRDPLLDVRLFRNRSFTVALGSMLLNTMLPGGTMVLITQHLQLVEKLSPLQAGLWFVPAFSASILGFQASPLLARRVRPAFLIAAGMLISVGGLIVLTQVPSTGGLAAVLTGFAMFNLGAGPLVTLGTNLVIGSVPPEKAGAAAAISQTSNELGFALGVAVLGSVAGAIYRASVAGAIPAGTPASTAQAVGDSPAAAIAAASQLPAQAAASLADAARQAFTNGLHAAAAISAIALLGVVVAVLVTLRGARPLGEAASSEGGR